MLHLNTIGDLSRNFRSQSSTGLLKQRLERLSQEVTTGQTADKTRTLKGDYLPLNSIERSLDQLEWHRTTLTETRIFVETAQRSLGVIQDHAISAGTNLVSLSTNAQMTVLGAVTQDTRQAFGSVLSALNARMGERSVFAGVATNAPAVLGVDEMMAELVTATAGATTAQQVADAITIWFDAPGGGFETSGYIGSTERLQPFDLGLGQSATFDVAADDTEVRDMLKGLAMGAILEDASFTLSNDEQRTLVRMAGEALLSADKKFAEYRAEVGTTEAELERASTRNAAETHALEIARADILGVDQYEAAGDLQSTQVQLEMLYSITARMSRLNLMEYLR